MGIREDSRNRAKRLGGHALVIGGSLAGLMAARVLSDYFDRVTLVERDRYPENPDPRKGVPQASHVHALMMRGQMILGRLFPGLKEEMTAAGALTLDMAGETAWLSPAGWGVRFDSDLKMLGFTRPLLDWHVRRRVANLQRVTILDETQTVSLLPAAGGVAGAILRPRSGQEMHVRADLVVDACGRASRAPQWLEELGYPRPAETVVNAFIGYGSRLYRIPEGREPGWKCAFVQAAPPERTRAGIIFPVEGGRWLLTLMGGGRDYPPSDEAGFLEFARSLADPIIYEAVKEAEPLSPIRSYRATENRLRHFERLSRRPDNFLATGDAVCAFNPVYGQGMTIAAMGALALEETLGRQRRGSLKDLARRFQKKLAKVCAAPWLLATSEDLRFRETEGASPNLATRLMHGYMDRVLRLTTADIQVRRVLLENFHMLKTPASLFHPRIVFRVLRQSPDKPRARRADESLPARTLGDTTY